MNDKICCICECNNSKYKCPKCQLLYCSVVCCRKHKECCSEKSPITNSKEDGGTEEIHRTNEYEFCTEDTVPIDKLEQLRYSEEVKNCLTNPEIRDIISSILKDKNPGNLLAKAMKESAAFVELADACLKVVEPSDDEKPC